LGAYPQLRPGELVALDIKSFGSLGRGGGRRAVMHRNGRKGVGWRYLHVAIDMASRLAFTQLRPNLSAPDAVGFLERATGFFAARGIHVARVLTDNGSAYRSNMFVAACRDFGIRHTHTKVRHPWTNGGRALHRHDPA
jgi:transposase InsO family protein